MFILHELIADKSPFRDKFVYINELIHIPTGKVDLEKIKDDHIIIIPNPFFGINKKRCLENKNREARIAKITKNILKKVNNKTCLYIGDCHEYSFIGGIQVLADICKEYHIDYMWSLYNKNQEINKLKKYMKEIGCSTKFICINNCVKGGIFRDYKLPKKHDIVLYGAISKRYPLRSRLYNLLKSKKFTKEFRVKVIEYGGAREEKLAKILNQSYLGVATGSEFNYLVKKYFEISACNCLIIGDIPEQGKSIFESNYIQLHNNMTDDRIFSIIKKHLNSIKLIKETSQKNHDMVHKKHLIKYFHKRLYAKIIS